MDEFDSLFANASVVGESDSEVEYLEIQHDFRTITIPKSKELLGVTSDENVNVLHFVCPRYYEKVDLNNFIFRINYLNAKGEGDQYWIDDKEVDGDNLTFSWTVGRHACKYSGTVNFIVCAFVLENQTIKQEYNTAIHRLPVVEGIETTEAIVDEKYDIIADLIERTKTLVDLTELEERITAATEAVEAMTGVQESVYDLTLSTNWSGDESPFSQAVTIPNYTVTNYTKVNLTATPETVAAMKTQGVCSIYIVNDNAVLTAYADGYKPTTALTVQASVYETKSA